MQTLVFNTTNKTVKLLSGNVDNSEILIYHENVPTVKVQNNFYEVMKIYQELQIQVPVLRVPINNTNMIIEK